MPTDNQSNWPLPKFHFEIDFGNSMNKIPFQEVSGLDIETQIIDYRKSNSPLFSVQKMPDIKKYGAVTLKKGIFVNDNSFWDWYKEVVKNSSKRSAISIRLLDEKNDTVLSWTLANALATKITLTDLAPTGKEITLETLALAHEGVSILNG